MDFSKFEPTIELRFVPWITKTMLNLNIVLVRRGGRSINVSFLLNGRLSEDTIILPTVMATLISFSYCGDLCGEIKFQQLAGLNNHYTEQRVKGKGKHLHGHNI